MSGSDFPEGRDWVKGEDGKWRDPDSGPEPSLDNDSESSGIHRVWNRFRSLSPWAQVTAWVLVGVVVVGFFSKDDEPAAIPTPTTIELSVEVYAIVAEDKCRTAFSDPAVRRVITATGEPGIDLAVANFMEGFRQSPDSPTDAATLRYVRAACEEGLREAAGL
jgi:hypothetical protein